MAEPYSVLGFDTTGTDYAGLAPGQGANPATPEQYGIQNYQALDNAGRFYLINGPNGMPMVADALTQQTHDAYTIAKSLPAEAQARLYDKYTQLQGNSGNRVQAMQMAVGRQGQLSRLFPDNFQAPQPAQMTRNATAQAPMPVRGSASQYQTQQTPAAGVGANIQQVPMATDSYEYRLRQQQMAQQNKNQVNM